MDRELRVMEGGYELAELLYNYDHPTSGKVKIKINRIYDLDDDMKSFYPLYEYETYFHHSAFKSLDELKSFDKDLLKNESDFAPHISGSLEYLYEPLVYRYLLTHRNTVGIAEINTDFNENTKEMKFLSARRQKEDLNLSSDSFETNKSMLKRMCEEYLDCYGVDFLRIGWN